jgi:5-methylcytosine-specific restriction protein A
MPSRLPSQCNHPGCRTACRAKYCDRHAKQHPKWASATRPRGTTSERGYGTHWQKLRVYVLDRARGLCQPCEAQGRTVIATEVDHITPKSQGGSDDADNCQAICHACHRAKTLREASEARVATNT